MRMKEAATTVDGTFTTWCSPFVHAKQECEIMMILTLILANLVYLSIGSPYMIP